MGQDTPLSSHPGTVPANRDATTSAPPHRIQPTRSAFLELPPEMRNMVYEWLFPKDWPVQLLARYHGGYIDMGECLGLLTTCRQVYIEVSSLLRCNRRFVVSQPKTFLDLISHSDDGRRHTMRGPLLYSVFESRIPRSLVELVRYNHPFRDISLRFDLIEGTFENRVPPIYSTCTKVNSVFMGACGSPWIFVTTGITDGFQGLEEWIQKLRMKLQPVRSMPEGLIVQLRLPRKDANGSTHHYFPAVQFIRAVKGLHNMNWIRVIAAKENGSYTLGQTKFFNLFAGIWSLVHRMCKIFPDHANRLLPPIWIDQNLKFVLADFNGRLYRAPFDVLVDGSFTALWDDLFRCRPELRSGSKDTLIGVEEELGRQIRASGHV